MTQSTHNSKTRPARLRRPPFDRERGVEIAQHLFHARGYDAVGVAELAQAMDVVAPSLYAAYGSKLELFERTLLNYVSTEALPLDQVLASPGTPSEVISGLFVAAARHYTKDPVLRGCMVTEAMRADDPHAAALAISLAEPAMQMIRGYVGRFAKAADVDRIVDYILLTLRGLSSYACLGYAQEKLVACSWVAGKALDAEFK